MEKPKRKLPKGMTPFTKENAAEMGARGGRKGRNNPNRALAQKLAWMRKKGLTDENAREMFELMTNSQMSSLDILKQIRRLKEMAQDSKEESVVIGRMVDWHKLHHGDKKLLDVRLAVVDLNAPLSEDARLLLLADLPDE